LGCEALAARQLARLLTCSLVTWGSVACDATPPTPTYSAARRVVEQHCISCHSEHPTERAFPIAPGGVVFDTPADMVEHGERIRIRVAVERTMPLMNKTGMTEPERELIARWVSSGMPTPRAPAASAR
jgi:uncharacterized membrane protein